MVALEFKLLLAMRALLTVILGMTFYSQMSLGTTKQIIPAMPCRTIRAGLNSFSSKSVNVLESLRYR